MSKSVLNWIVYGCFGFGLLLLLILIFGGFDFFLTLLCLASFGASYGAHRWAGSLPPN